MRRLVGTPRETRAPHFAHSHERSNPPIHRDVLDRTLLPVGARFPLRPRDERRPSGPLPSEYRWKILRQKIGA
jgi:hypothetical protein